MNIIVHDSGDQTTFLIVPFRKYSTPQTTRPSFSPVAPSFTFAAETNSMRGKEWGGKKVKEQKKMTENKVVKAIARSVGILRTS